MSERPRTPLLDRVSLPADLKGLSAAELRQLADELRAETISAVSETGGHLGAGLGVVELTVAIHAVFNAPRDKVIWDVGHQAYPHKILTGRRERIRTLRAGGGLSGFTRRAESDYDPFGAAHSSTSISAGLGFAVARDLGAPGVGDVVAVIGDGAMSAGMAYEAMNNAGHLKTRLFVVLNDNEMSIAPPVGAMSSYLSRLYAGEPFQDLKAAAKGAVRLLPQPLQEGARRARELVKGITVGGTLFEELGFSYVGPIDGHDLDQLTAVLRTVRARADGPVLIHAVTRKGKGYPPAEASADKYHGVAKFDVVTGAQQKKPSNAPCYTSVFAQSLIRAAERDERIVAVTAAMPDGTGLDKFAARFPRRSFDVGIAEQHAVTFCAGMAAAGMKPFCAIYSTFLQRGYDQVVHDVAIQRLPVRFAIDRAGLVGADGPTHAGAFDIAYLACLPDFVVMAAADEAELVHMVATAVAHRRPPLGLPLPARRGRRRRDARRGRAARDRPRPHRAGRAGGRDPLLRRPPRRVPEGRRGARRPRHPPDRRRRPLRQAPRPRADPPPRPRPRGPRHHRGRLGRRLRQPRRPAPRRRGRLRPRAEVPLDGAARQLHPAGQPGKNVRRRRDERRADRGEGSSACSTSPGSARAAPEG